MHIQCIFSIRRVNYITDFEYEVRFWNFHWFYGISIDLMENFGFPLFFEKNVAKDRDSTVCSRAKNKVSDLNFVFWCEFTLKMFRNVINAFFEFQKSRLWTNNFFKFCDFDVNAIKLHTFWSFLRKNLVTKIDPIRVVLSQKCGRQLGFVWLCGK